MTNEALKRKLSVKEILIGLVVGGFVIYILAVVTSKTPGKPVAPDKDLFIAYYKTLLAKAKPIDVAYRGFSDPLARKDYLRAAIVAKNIKDDMNQRWGELDSIDVPSLANADTSKQLKQAHDSISSAYLHKTELIQKYLEFTQQPSLFSAADFMDNAEKHQQQLYGGLLKVMAVGYTVGVKPEEFPK